MACKNDESWEGTYVYKDSCVKWDDLTDLRKDFNKLWDILKKEEKQDGDKYGYVGENNSAKEQIEPLATIEGFFGLRYEAATQSVDQIHFYITAGTILDRLKGIGTQYSYDHEPQGTNFGPWIVWLKDECHACTVFRLQNNDIKYARSLVCNYNYIANIDNDAWRLQCIWSSNGCNYPAEVLGDWEDYCHINWDWRDPEYYQKYLLDVADKLFIKGPICVPFDDPCTVTRRWCCGLYAIAHYTEEDCDYNGPCEEYPGYVCRRLKYVSLGVTSSNPGEEVHGPYIPESGAASSWDYFFCCPNQITGGQLKGYVTQKISAIHLTDIWDRTNKMVGGKTLRKCFYNQCKYYEASEKKYRWVHKKSVPMYAGGTTADIMDRKDGPCENCDKAAVGASICACNFNDINAMLDEYNAATCSCQNEGENKGKTLTNFGSVTDCDCCKTLCCCDCQCSEELSQAECLKKECKKNGPKWVGVYEEGESKEDKKMRDSKPCGCYEGGNDPDPKFPDVNCMEICGKTAACCYDNDGTCCEEITKCDCDDKKGTWHGFRSSDGEYKGSSWKKGDPKRCGDEDIQEIPSCGRTSACCNTETCQCEQKSQCACDEDPYVWQGLTSDGKSKSCSDDDVKNQRNCGAIGACCENGVCGESTDCDCSGTWFGAGSTCEEAESSPDCQDAWGACCQDGSCVEVYESECEGTFKGADKSCDLFEDDEECNFGTCGVCSDGGNPNSSGECECCPSEDGCDCGTNSGGKCCCCPADERPQKQQDVCRCVVAVCPE